MSGFHPETFFLQHILSSLPDLGYSETLTLGGASRQSRSIFTTKQGPASLGFCQSRGCWSKFPFCAVTSAHLFVRLRSSCARGHGAAAALGVRVLAGGTVQ